MNDTVTGLNVGLRYFGIVDSNCTVFIRLNPTGVPARVSTFPGWSWLLTMIFPP
ncbi:hypothetical protein [Allocoleopsis franciscana]|uniref:hypothetical protein n=1 Tax=Allocoleopsis franciscana TaxID=2886352 RepID=UPI0002F7830C|nr:hypothetical protein [Allocoleopsis franciscana]